MFSFNHAQAHRHIHSFPTRRSSDLLESTESKERERKKVEGVLEFLRRANGLLQSALSAAVSTSKTKGVSEQVGEKSEEHTSELQSRRDLVCRLLLEKKNIKKCYNIL